MPKIFVIILNWNRYKDTLECLRSLQKLQVKNYKLRILITGVNGEIGQSILPHLSGHEVVGLDLTGNFIRGDILDRELLSSLFEKKIDWVLHFAAILSSSAEGDVFGAHRVNVEGSVGLLELCLKAGAKFFFPSSIAVYGMGSIENKNKNLSVSESEFNEPVTVYGLNKLYVEKLGDYLKNKKGLDFCAIRFPGLISETTLPSGGTTDWAALMLDSAKKDTSYKCFVREDTVLPFMKMEEAVLAIIKKVTVND